MHVGLIIFDPRFGAFVWALTANALHSQATQRGLRLTTVPVRSLGEQATEIERLIAKKIDAIVMKPMATNDAAITRVLEKAAQAGIPVITLDSPLACSAVTCTVGSDNRKGQRLVAQEVLERLGGRGKVAHFCGDPNVPAGVIRSESFHELLTEYPLIDLAYERSLHWIGSVDRRAQGAQFMREALDRVPGIKAIVSASDEGALGAIDVLAERGLTGKVIVAGFDGIPEALLAVQSGALSWTVRQLPGAIARATLDVVERAVAGEAVPKTVHVSVELITGENLFAAALDSLQMIPGLIHHLSENHEVQRQLQQAVITTQQNILQTVAAVSTAVSSIRERDEMMGKVVDLVCSRFALCETALYILDGSQGLQRRAVRATSVQEADECAGESFDDTLIVQCFDTQELQVRRDEAAGAALALPLRASERSIGVLHLQSTRPDDFDDDKTMVLQGIAHQVSIAIDNANLYEETIRRAKQQEEDQEKLLIAEKMASLGRLTAGIAHEMNTPLAAVRSALHELQSLVHEYRDSIGDASVNDHDHRDIVKEMEQSLTLASSAAEKAAGFVRGVKSQTRDLSAQQLVTFNAVTVIQEAILLLSHALRHGNCTTQFRPSSEVIELRGSPGRLAQVVTNLITNAIDACKDQGGCEIEILLTRQGEHVELKVSDRGCGIPPDVLPRIFDPMFTTKPFGEGTGLGLTIVHDIVTGDFGGTIRIESTAGQGTTFVLSFANPKST